MPCSHSEKSSTGWVANPKLAILLLSHQALHLLKNCVKFQSYCIYSEWVTPRSSRIVFKLQTTSCAWNISESGKHQQYKNIFIGLKESFDTCKEWCFVHNPWGNSTIGHSGVVPLSGPHCVPNYSVLSGSSYPAVTVRRGSISHSVRFPPSPPASSKCLGSGADGYSKRFSVVWSRAP